MRIFQVIKSPIRKIGFLSKYTAAIPNRYFGDVLKTFYCNNNNNNRLESSSSLSLCILKKKIYHLNNINAFGVPNRSLFTSHSKYSGNDLNSNSKDPEEILENTSGSPPHQEVPQVLGKLESMLTLVFTCNICQNRNARQFSKHSYEHGIVIIQCPSCNTRHLIADHLGWFEGFKGKTIEDVMADKGQEVHKLNSEMIDIPDDLRYYVEDAYDHRQKSLERRGAFREKVKILQSEPHDDLLERGVVMDSSKAEKLESEKSDTMSIENNISIDCKEKK